MKNSKNDMARINAALKVLEFAGLSKDTQEMYGWNIGSTSVEEAAQPTPFEKSVDEALKKVGLDF